MVSWLLILQFANRSIILHRVLSFALPRAKTLSVDSLLARWPACYDCHVTKPLTVTEFARMGGKARAKLPPEELSRIGKLGGRPRKNLTKPRKRRRTG